MSIADDYNIQNVFTQTVYADFGRRVYPKLLEMWDELVKAKEVFDEHGSAFAGNEAETYHKFFTHVFDTIQVIGEEQQKQKEQSEKEFERMRRNLEKWEKDGVWRVWEML